MSRWVRPINAAMNQMFRQVAGAAWGVLNAQTGHPGCDYAAPMGTVVCAASDGKVIWAGQNYDGGFGYHPVAIYHPADNVTTLYGHMEEHIVSIGQQVYAGQEIGLCDTQGFSSGSHLHAELRSGQRIFGNAGDSSDFDAWLHSHGAYGGTPWQPAGQLGPNDRACINRTRAAMQMIQTGAWDHALDGNLGVVRYAKNGKLKKTDASTQVAMLQRGWGMGPADQDGLWGPRTDSIYSMLRFCYLNK